MKRAALAGALVLVAGCLSMLELKAEPGSDARLGPLNFSETQYMSSCQSQFAEEPYRR